MSIFDVDDLWDETPVPSLSCEMSDDQVVAMGLFSDWYRNSIRQEFRLGGLAGTGKTTLIKAMLSELSGAEVDVITPTAKAAEVLGRKGVDAKTSHSLLCNFEYESKDDDGRIVPVFSDKGIKRKIIICDEASMVTSEMREKILECAERVVWVGDYGQLPPVEKGSTVGGVLKEENLDAKLTVQHRHGDALEIVKFAEYLRGGGDPLKYKTGERSVSEGPGGLLSQVTINRHGVRGVAGVARWCLAEGVWPVICYTNEFIGRFNLAIRKLQNAETGSIYRGLKLACIFNSYRHNVVNGELFEVEKLIGWRGSVAEIRTTDGKQFPVSFSKDNQGGAVRVMDGYAITCHKSQGSEWRKIAVIEERSIMSQPAKWRYTAATRAQNQVDYFTKGAV